MFGAVVAEFTGPVPTVLLVEDLHRADDATPDVVGYLAELPVVVVLTYRNDSVPVAHPVHRLLGASAGCPVHRLLGASAGCPVHRLLGASAGCPVHRLAPLSTRAMGGLAAGSGWDLAAPRELTGQPVLPRAGSARRWRTPSG